jgi:hypothetical protein
MRKWLFAAVAIIATLCSTSALARPLTLNEISEAICRVNMGGWGGQSAGTGTCIGETPDGQSYYILTNAHVVGQHQQGTVEFFKGGYKTTPLPATVVWRAYYRGSDVDFAVMTVDKSLFGNQPPRIIPLAPEGYAPTTGHYIAAVGCPSARWAQAWEGHITMDRGSRVLFVPSPISGQSGSGVTVLIQGNDGEWYTRVGAVLTWRIGDGSGAQGGAIPVGTLYGVMQGRHTAYTVPTNYHEVKYVSQDSDGKQVEASTIYGVATGKYALGSNGKIYPVYLGPNGYATVNLEQDFGVQIVTWDYANSKYYPQYGSCPGGRCPPSSGGGSWGWRRPSPQPPAPQPQPRPSPGVPPYSQPNPGGGGQNPYGTNPPSIGAPWPGSEPKPEPETPKPEIAPPVPAPAPQVTPSEIERLEAELEKLREKKEKEDAAAAAAAQEKEAGEKPGLIGAIKNRVNGFFGGILAGAGIGLLIFVWNKFLKKKVIQRVDSLQDYLEGKIKDKWGDNLAKEARDVMEGVEDALLGFADDFLEDMQARKQVAKSLARGKPAERVTNGSGLRRNINVKEILEAVREASREVGDDEVTEGIPRKVDEILNRVSQQKRNGG